MRFENNAVLYKIDTATVLEAIPAQIDAVKI